MGGGWLSKDEASDMAGHEPTPLETGKAQQYGVGAERARARERRGGLGRTRKAGMSGEHLLFVVVQAAEARSPGLLPWIPSDGTAFDRQRISPEARKGDSKRIMAPKRHCVNRSNSNRRPFFFFTVTAKPVNRGVL